MEVMWPVYFQHVIVSCLNPGSSIEKRFCAPTTKRHPKRKVIRDCSVPVRHT